MRFVKSMLRVGLPFGLAMAGLIACLTCNWFLVLVGTLIAALIREASGAAMADSPTRRDGAPDPYVQRCDVHDLRRQFGG